MRLAYAYSGIDYPQDKHLIDGLRELGHEVKIIQEKPGIKSFLKARKRIIQETADCDAIFVGFTCPLFVVAARLATRKPVIFNAVLSQYEANIISRGEVGHLFLKTIKWWLVDFVSLHLASKALMESKTQIDFISRRFLVRKKKMVRSFSGLDEHVFFYDASIAKLPTFTVVFRGRFLPESGILTVIEAAKKLESSGVRFLVIGHGFLYREVNALMARLAPKNLEMIRETIPPNELRKKMLECHVSLGQLADHPRLDRTLPCKLFESLAMKLPYLTGRNKAVFEILEEGISCIAAKPGDADDLVKNILYLRDNPEVRDRIAAAGYDLYKRRLTSKILAHVVMAACFK